MSDRSWPLLLPVDRSRQSDVEPIYRAIGYEPVADVDQYRFTD